jgi:hypothetical protein
MQTQFLELYDIFLVNLKTNRKYIVHITKYIQSNDKLIFFLVFPLQSLKTYWNLKVQIIIFNQMRVLHFDHIFLNYP